MLKARVLAALLFAPALFAVIFVGGWLLLAVCALLAALMHEEARRLLVPRPPLPILLASWLSAAAIFCHSVELLSPALTSLLLPSATVVMLMATLVSSGAWEARASAAGLSMFAALYGAGLIGLVATLRARPGDGLPLALLAVFVPWAADTGAYFAGRAFGRHKLAPRISPAKTIEGLIGGISLALLLALALVAVDGELPALPMLVTAAAAALMGTIGDLSESLLKRGAGAKDSGSLIPGHGGVLDRFDSVLFATWLVYAMRACW